jgi:hypothetical protein
MSTAAITERSTLCVGVAFVPIAIGQSRPVIIGALPLCVRPRDAEDAPASFD